jgi:polyferredoxin
MLKDFYINENSEFKNEAKEIGKFEMEVQYKDSNSGRKIDLFDKIPLLKKFVKTRIFQNALVFPNLVVFYLIVIAGLIGTPVGNKNIAIVFIWILWWFLLIAIMVPFASRIWCTMCPLPFFGELFQRLSVIKVRPGKTGGIRNKLFGFNLNWPKRLRNIWVQNFGFLILCTFSAILVTRPFVTAVVLGGLIILGLVLAIVYKLRVFCSYICPVSGFLSLYSTTSMIELRSKSFDECKKCRSKACMKGNEDGYGCPWFIYMGKLERNNYCGLCMECVKSCPNDNIALNLRKFASETNIKGYDEAWKGFIMLSLAMAYSVILLGTNGTIKDWANVTETGMWSGFLNYALILWMSSLVVLPLIFLGCSFISKLLVNIENIIIKDIFLSYSYVLVPLGLFAWIAFSVPLIFINGSYIISVISDPLGWGWDLFGTAGVKWEPLWPEYLVYIQIILLLTGLYFAITKAYDIGLKLFSSNDAALKGLIPISIFSLIICLAFLSFFIG